MTDEYSRHRQTDDDIPFWAELFHGHDRNDVCSLPASDRGRGGATDVVDNRREDVGTTCLLNPNWTPIEHVPRGVRHAELIERKLQPLAHKTASASRYMAKNCSGS
jgi:hypothetical protein